MNNTYTFTEKSIKTVIDNIDNLETKIERFQSKYPNYKYKVNLKKNKDKWNVEVNISNEDEHTSTNTSERTIGSCRVL